MVSFLAALPYTLVLQGVRMYIDSMGQIRRIGMWRLIRRGEDYSYTGNVARQESTGVKK